MAKKNYRREAMANLNYGIGDLRDPAKREEIAREEAKIARAEKEASSSSSFLRQSDIARCMQTVPGFETEPDQYGPTVAEITDILNGDREENDKLSRNRVAQHLAKLRSEEIIGSAPKLGEGGKRGRPEVFYFLQNAGMFEKVLSGDYTAKG
jgi:hypothetical protein